MASRHPEIPRARFRVLFFTTTAAVCAVAGWWPAVGCAALCTACGLASLLAAHRKGRSLALTFVALDWLGIALMWALTGGASSPLIFATPLLVTGHLLPTRPGEWPLVMAPSLAGLAVLLIADSTVSGSRSSSFFELSGLLLAGLILPVAVRRRSLTCRRREQSARLDRPRHPRTQARPGDRTPAVDPTTGFYGVRQVRQLVTGMVHNAARDHEAMGVVCVRLVDWAAVRDSRGELAAEAAAAAAARCVRRFLRPVDLAFRVCGDTFLLVLKDRTTSQATAVAAELQAALAAHHYGRRGEQSSLTAGIGVSSYPAVRSVSELLSQAAHRAAAEVDPVRACSPRW